MLESPHPGFNGPHGESFGIVGTDLPACPPETATSDIGLIRFDDCVAILLEAAAGPEQLALSQVVDSMLANQVPIEMIAGHCFPEVARALGAAWRDDSMAFSTVTVGCSRLEAKLHDLDACYEEDGHLDSCILLLVPQDETHTLGARILALQLRRRRTSVRVMVGEPLAQIARVLAESRFDGVFISAAHGNDIKSIRDLTMTIRTATKVVPLVILGGAILKDNRFDHLGLVRLTGADLVCDDPDEALHQCGIIQAPRAIKQRTRGI